MTSNTVDEGDLPTEPTANDHPAPERSAEEIAEREAEAKRTKRLWNKTYREKKKQQQLLQEQQSAPGPSTTSANASTGANVSVDEETIRALQYIMNHKSHLKNLPSERLCSRASVTLKNTI
jgi:hypothetical protein